MNAATVSIITRTKDRGLLLERAIKSVLAQTYGNWEMIIVNDGGSRQVVDDLAGQYSAEFASRLHVIHNEKSLGMERASNVGIHASTGDYLIIHDDDDTWEPLFLERCVSYLEEKGGENCGGVVTRSMRVDEEIVDGQVRIINKRPYNPHVHSIDLYKIAGVNQFPPIAFLFRRKVLDTIGNFNGDLPVLGDWEFNLRVLREFDVHMLPERLANYHLRPKDRGSIYSNTIIGGLDKHIHYKSRLMNQFAREDIKADRLGLGLLTNIAPYFEDVFNRLWHIEEKLEATKSFMLLDYYGKMQELLGKTAMAENDRAEFKALQGMILAAAKQGLRLNEDTDLRFTLFQQYIDSMVKEGRLRGDNNIYIFGASTYGERIQGLLLSHGIRLKGFFDNDAQKIGKLYNGVNVTKPESGMPLDGPVVVIVASIGSSKVIHEQIRDLLDSGKCIIISVHGLGI